MYSKYEELIKYVKQTEALSHASGLIAWDQETKMPKDIFDTCVNSLMQYGYTKTEAQSLVSSVDDPFIWHDPVQIIKQCLSNTNV